jgi:predicted metalloprotease with PDZ domain
MVVVIPESGRSGVLFGKVLPESSPAIALLVGRHTKKTDLDRDWILVHELYHLGFPSFQAEGKWLDEGLATYYEPIIRTRAGLRTEASLWEEFVSAMPQGLGAVGRDGLENAQSFRGIYWGGAIVALLADIEIRRRSGGKQGLEDGLLTLLDNDGHASEVWDLKDAIGVVDRTIGAPVLGDLAARYATRGHPLELDRLFSDLGVKRTAVGVKLDDSAPLARVRRAIVHGAPASL